MVETDPIYPFKGHYLDQNGLNYHYLDQGHGEPLLMLHGNPTWSIYYRELIEAFSPKYRCIAPDHMGCGLSDKPDDSQYSYTLSQRVDDLAHLLHYLNIHDNLTLILHDWGGMIGMAYATRYPQAIKRIILLNTAAFHLPPNKAFPWPLWLGRDTHLGAFLIRRFNAFSRIATHVCCTRKKMSPQLRNAYCAPYNSWANRIATLRFVQDIPLKPTDRGYELVSEVQAKLEQFKDLPILICWGEKDFVFDLKFLKVWQTLWPNATVHRFPDCGHYVLEDATEEIKGLINHFLHENPIAEIRSQKIV